MERLAPLSCKFAHADYRLHIVAIDVEYRSAEGPGDVGAVPGRPAGAPIGRAGDPVVQNDVDGPSGGVVLEGAQVERLVNHSLAGEGTVTVDHYYKTGLCSCTFVPVVIGPGTNESFSPGSKV